MIHPCPNCGQAYPMNANCANHSYIVTNDVTPITLATPDRHLLLAEGAVIALRGLLAKAEQENAELRATVERLKSGGDEELEHKVQAVLLKHFADKGACCSIDALTEYVMEPVTAALAGLKGERDALRKAIVKACVEMKDAYDEGELSIWCQSIWKELEAALQCVTTEQVVNLPKSNRVRKG